jgi:hypothetical protein
MALTKEERAVLAALVAEAEQRASAKFRRFFPDDGPLARHRYPKQLEFFAPGATFKERLFLAANRVGNIRSRRVRNEVPSHRPLSPLVDRPALRSSGGTWAVGTNSQTTRDIVQAKLLGPVLAPGTGMIPAHLIHSTSTAQA